MTIKELIQSGQGKEFVYASCSRCIRKGKPVFHIRIDDPKEEDLLRVRSRAERHDRKGTHPVLIIINKR